MYSLKVADDSGYKPYGALGQGDANNLNIDLTSRGTADTKRVMEITLYAVGTYNMAANPDVTVIKVGSYPWSTTDFSTP